jgi:hypothetical protein
MDGMNWTGLGNIGITVTSIDWNGIMWIAVGFPNSGSYGIAYSYDGINWTIETAAFSQNLTDVKWTGTYWVITNETDIYYYSSDGFNWSNLNLPVSSYQLNGLYWDGINWIFFGVGSGLSYSILYTTAITTAPSNITYNPFTTTNGITSRNGLYVAVGSGTNTVAYANSLTSSWTYVSSIFTSSGNGIDWNGKMFVAVGSGTNSIAYSYDGITWNGIGVSILSTGNKVSWTGKKWIATGTGTFKMAISGDGIHWSGVPTSSNLFTTAYGIGSNSRIGATVGDSQMILTNKNTPNTQTVDMVSNSYYDSAYTNFTSTITTNNL